MKLKIAIGADDAGFTLRDALCTDLNANDRISEVVSIGAFPGDPDPYPRIGLRAAEMIAAGAVDRAVLICGTGLGMAISANKVRGVRAVCAHDIYSVRRSILSNNAQVLTFGQRVIGIELARALLEEWIRLVFDPESPSAQKLAVIDEYECG